ncbi:similar to Saccharomyces cerevisiae YGR280C PXR1 Essential protein involved in rRNA and snoRNA maturation [Maudiozyma barnettii]|uniref:Protein PXR1 n=1 Tax=Maudiozyma barnettii TaxID=61262 RepID=A0A8H2VIM2_9SACH|nr:telomerase inhibitor [Kazachstania barnettii]CAB4256152.1 similar to Saccharomyces cerevisiae YGR280C PXR1 Essential protein involved in rRNA and snoRNA maturation [Kazachstania barnettii]CAD1784760.1 similar to Saccharomyces cerevisiae YGR280C PXR1 Essential protein involved in rRNA and snoRNA maturation [Kazachstania barnettii]
MGLAATRVKQRFGRDPRNTNWSNDTSRFGHQQLERFGWKPGMGLGMAPMHSHTSHIKVHVKDDNVGLGAKISRKGRKDEFDNGECAGLDVFQRILGRLNGKEQEIENELDLQRKEKILDGKWGVHFVKADVLASTWDPKTKKIKSYSNKKSNSSDDEEEEEPSKKKKKNKRNRSDDDDNDEEEKKHHKKHKHSSDKKKAKKAAKKAKKAEKAAKKAEKKSAKKALKMKSSKTASNIPTAITTRLSVRSKWIKQKRAAVMDAKALNEIFMITNE